MSADAFIARLDRPKQTGPGRWVACCPAHEDRTPSMTVRELDDGTVLIHCFAGCSVEQIIGAVGLEFDALFPGRPKEYWAPLSRPFNAHDVLEAVAEEAQLVAVASANLQHGVALSDADHERLMLAAERLNEARRLGNGER